MSDLFLRYCGSWALVFGDPNDMFRSRRISHSKMLLCSRYETICSKNKNAKKRLTKWKAGWKVYENKFVTFLLRMLAKWNIVNNLPAATLLAFWTTNGLFEKKLLLAEKIYYAMSHYYTFFIFAFTYLP